MGDFSDPINVLKEELEDLRMDIDLKEKELKKVNEKLREAERNKELLEAEVEELKEEEEKMMKDLERAEIENR